MPVTKIRPAGTVVDLGDGAGLIELPLPPTGPPGTPGLLSAASEAEARAGTDNVKAMTPLRVTQALREDGYINPKRLGAVGDTVLATSVGTDDTTAWQDAIDEAMEAIATGEPERAEIRPGPGNYLITEPLELNQFSMKIRGNGRNGSRLIIDHDGIGVRFYRSDWVLEDIGVHASLTRAALSYDVDQIGILLEGPTAGTSNFGGRLRNVVSQSHPGHGIVLIGSSIECVLAEARSNKGHGLVFDTGRIRGLTGGDLVPQGFSTVIQPRAVNNGGHGFVMGHPDDDSSAFVLRMSVFNMDSGPNATDAAVRYTADDSFAHGEDMNIYTCGMQGGDGGAGGNWTLAGKSVHVYDQRSVAAAAWTANVKAYAGILPANINVDIGRVIGAAQNPAVVIDSGVAAYVVNATARDTSNVTSIATASKTGQSRLGVQHEFRGGRLGADSFYGALLGSVGDDQVLKVQLNASISGIFEIWGSSSAARSATFYATVGSSPVCTIMSETFFATATTGALAAGAGADDDLTISAHTDDCLYISNRTGGTRTYHLLIKTQTNARVTGVTLIT